MKKRVWIDTDLSVGMKRHTRKGYCDVDDGYAIWQLMNAPEAEVVGMSAVFGNTQIDDAYRLCNYMNEEFADSKIPVYKGAGEALKLDNIQTNEAVEALAEALRKEPLTIMAIGPATNVGLLAILHPELTNQIKEVVLVAGRRKAADHFTIGTRAASAPDLNFDLDNDAFRLMFQHNLNLTFCPFEISNKVWVGKADLDKLAASGHKANQWLAEKSRNWLDQWIEIGENGFNPFDVLASHYILRPQDVVCEALNARLEVHSKDNVDENDGSIFKQFLLCDKSAGYPINYCFDVSHDYHERLMESLLS
jgi:inosine-uridine nucleoside N-ribohydrolase